MTQGKQWLCAVLCMSILVAGGAGANPAGPPAIQLGPLFRDTLNPEGIRLASLAVGACEERYGESFFRWPHPARARISRLLEGMSLLPDTLLSSHIPGDDDLREPVVQAAAWEALIQAHPQALAAREWYETSCAVTFGAKDGQEACWWVTYLPFYNFPQNLKNTTPQPDAHYTVQLSRDGQVMNILRRPTMDDTMNQADESMNPLMVYLRHLFFLRNGVQKPLHAWTDEEKLDLNLPHLFPHLNDGKAADGSAIVGLPQDGHIQREEAVRAAHRHVARMGAFRSGEMDTQRTDATFITGHSGTDAPYPPETYPFWHIALWSAAGDPMGHMRVSGTSGEVWMEEY